MNGFGMEFEVSVTGEHLAALQTFVQLLLVMDTFDMTKRCAEYTMSLLCTLRGAFSTVASVTSAQTHHHLIRDAFATMAAFVTCWLLPGKTQLRQALQ